MSSGPSRQTSRHPRALDLSINTRQRIPLPQLRGRGPSNQKQNAQHVTFSKDTSTPRLNNNNNNQQQSNAITASPLIRQRSAISTGRSTPHDNNVNVRELMNPSSILDDVTNNFQSQPQQKKRYKTTSTFNDNQVTAVSQHTLDAQTRTLQSKHQLEYQQKYDEVEETLLSNDLSKIERTNTLISDIQEGIGKLQLEAEAKQASIEESMRVKLLRPVFQFNGETLQSALIMEAAFENEKYRVAAQVKNISAKESSLKSRLETILARERDVKSKMELIKEDERKTVTSLERRQATITEQESSLKSRSSNLTQREEMLNQFKEELDKRESNVNKQETTLTEREATLDTQGLRLQSRSEELDERQSTINEQETTLVERKTTLDTHASKLTEFRSSLVECKEKLERDQRAVKEQTDELSRSKTALDDRQSALDERQFRVTEQELRVTQHKEEIERVKTANDQRAEELEQSKTTLEQSKTTLKQDQAVLCQHQSRIKEQETQLKSQLDVLSRDKTALDEREVTVVQREAHLKSQSDKLAIDTDELAKLKAELDKRQSTLTEQESRLKDHRDEEIENQQEYKYVADDLSLPKEKFNEVYKSHFGFDASAEVHQKIEELQNYEYDKLDYENEPMLVRKKVHELVVTRGSDIHNSRVKKLLRKHALKAINLVRDEGKDFSEDCEWLNSAGKINIGESAVCRIMAIPSIGFFIIYQQNQINENYGMSTLQNDAGLLDNDHRQPMDSLMHYVHKSGEACVKSMMNFSNYIPMWAIINQKVKSSKTLVLTERVESSTGELIEHAILPHNSESVNASIQRFHVKHVLHLLENAEKGMPTLLTDRACALLSSEGYDIKEMYATEYNSEEDASMEGGNDSDPDFDPNGNGGFEQEEESDGSEPMSLVDEDEIMSFGTTDGSLPPMNQSRSRRRPSKHSHNDSDSDELSSDRGPFRARPAKKISKKQLQLELDNSSDSDSSDSDSSDSDVPIKKKKAATKPKKTKPKKAKLKKPESELSSSESSDSETKKKKKKKKKKIDNNTKTNSKKVKSKSKEKQKLTVQVVSRARQMASSLATSNGSWNFTSGDIDLLSGYTCSNTDGYEWVITAYTKGSPNGSWLEAEVHNRTLQMFPAPNTEQDVDLLETDIIFSGSGHAQRLPNQHFEKVLDAAYTTYERIVMTTKLDKSENLEYNALGSRKVMYKIITHSKLWLLLDVNNEQREDELFDPSKYVNTRFLEMVGDKKSLRYREMSLTDVVKKITNVMTRRRQTQRDNAFKARAIAAMAAAEAAEAAEAGIADD